VSDGGQFSVARLAVLVMGAGVVGLAVVGAVTLAVAQASAGAALVVVLLGLVAVIALMGFVARRSIDRTIRTESTHTGQDGESRREGNDR
jgi:nitrate reductase gamma subunit